MARLFHRLTSFEPGDLEHEPPLFKTFPSELPVVPLPRELPAPEAETLAALGRPVAEAAALDLAQLARLLHLSAGIVRTEDRSGGRIIPFRAGGRFPLEVYVVVPGGSGRGSAGSARVPAGRARPRAGRAAARGRAPRARRYRHTVADGLGRQGWSPVPDPIPGGIIRLG
jgi:hypothetical protein